MLGVELAAVKQQRRNAWTLFAKLHFANEDHVITFFVAAAVEAFKGRCSASQQGCTAESVGEFNAFPTVVALTGEAFGQFFLVGC